MSEFRPVLYLSDLSGRNGFRIVGEDPEDNTRGGSFAGDVNGDGLADIIIGAPSADANGINIGAAYVVFGSTSGFQAELPLSSLDGSNGFQLTGVSEYDGTGSSLTAAGDVNGDGFADIIVGAPFTDSPGSGNGTAYVVFGHAGGFQANLSLSNLNGANGFNIRGNAGDRIGGTVSSAGDINGDGFDDVILGTQFADRNGLYNTGASYVVFGKAGGFAASFNVSSLNGSNGFEIIGEDHYDYSGAHVAAAGDINGDGFGDVMVTAVPYGGGSNTYVVFGRGSGFSAELNLSSLSGSDGFEFSTAGGKYNSDRVASAGDVNGDGFADIIVGAPFSGLQFYTGTAYVLFGKAGGFDANISGSSLNGADGFRLRGDAAYDYVGMSVSTAGDVNGDGFDDLLIGSTVDNPSRAGDVFTFVVFGKAGGFDADVSLSGLDGSNGFKISGENPSLSVSSAGDLNGDGFDDLIVGGGDNASYVIFGHRALEAVTRIGTALDNTINGGRGDDIVAGLAGDDHLIGWEGKDILRGGRGQDLLVGRSGHDHLAGGLGSDILVGNQGNDVFDFNLPGDSRAAAGARDVIRDFNRGEDRIDLSDLGAFDFIGMANFSGASQINVVQVGDVAKVQINLTSSGGAEMWIALKDVSAASLTVEDFIL